MRTAFHPSFAMRVWHGWLHLTDRLTPGFDLLLRLYLFRVFFQSGWLKLSHWDGTLYLFQFEYHVPLLPPALAAVLATCAELGLSSLLLAGFGTRFAAPGLFILNAVAVISYPALTPEAVKDHYLWGSLLAVLWFHGAGLWSLDIIRQHRRCPPP